MSCINKITLGDASSDTRIIKSEDIDCSDIPALVKSTDDIDKLYDTIGLILEKFGGTYIRKHIPDTGVLRYHLNKNQVNLIVD